MIGVIYSDISLLSKTRKLAARLGLPLSNDSTSELEKQQHSFLLVVDKDRLELQATESHQKPVYVDFLDSSLIFRITHNGGKKQLIGKAIGIKSNYKPYVLDATAGLGVDAMVIACLGCEVHMIERSPIIGALLADGLERLEKARQEKKVIFLPQNFSLKLTVADSIEYLKNFSDNKKPDVIYLDPMYPERKKSALGKQQMRLIKETVGEDLDAPDLLEAALKLATNRVVVKRSRLAPPLASHRKIDIVFKGNSSRYDVYIPSQCD